MVVTQQLHIACGTAQRRTLKSFSVFQRHRGVLSGAPPKRLQRAQKADQVGAVLIDNVGKGRHAGRRNAIVQELYQFVIGT